MTQASAGGARCRTPRDARLPQFVHEIHVVDLAVAEPSLFSFAVVVVDQLMRGGVVDLQAAPAYRADKFLRVELSTTILVPGLERFSQYTGDRTALADHDRK